VKREEREQIKKQGLDSQDIPLLELRQGKDNLHNRGHIATVAQVLNARESRPIERAVSLALLLNSVPVVGILQVQLELGYSFFRLHSKVQHPQEPA